MEAEKEKMKGRPITQEDINSKAIEMRIKYGSKAKQKESGSMPQGTFNSSRVSFMNQKDSTQSS